MNEEEVVVEDEGVEETQGLTGLSPGLPVIAGFITRFKRWAIGILILMLSFCFLLGFLFGWAVFA